MHTCVIGGNGFIGTHVVETLVNLGRQVTVIDKNQLPSTTPLIEVRYITGDYGVRDFLVKSLKDVNEVIHLAYSTVPKTSFENPINDIINNTPGNVMIFMIWVLSFRNESDSIW